MVVVRGFDDDMVTHYEETVDPLRDLQVIRYVIGWEGTVDRCMRSLLHDVINTQFLSYTFLSHTLSHPLSHPFNTPFIDSHFLNTLFMNTLIMNTLFLYTLFIDTILMNTLFLYIPFLNTLYR